jgi:glycosyltransferase involved in cell wall biosynthesis
LSKEFGIPWIADYRDPWSQNFSSKKGYLQRKLDLFFEKKIVKSCSKIITVDALFKLKIGQLFPQKAFEILPNGFDEEQIARCSGIDQNSKQLTFSFIGTIYKWHPLELILNDFSNFAKSHPEKPFILKFYGTNCPEHIEELVESKYSNLKDTVVIYNKLPNGELLQSLATDNVLLLFNYYNFTGTKIYDYLGLKRKIVLCYSDSAEARMLKDNYYFHSIETDVLPQIDIIQKTNSGIVVQDSKHLLSVIEELYIEFQSTGKIACNSVGVENYSRKIQVEKLAEIVKELTA